LVNLPLTKKNAFQIPVDLTESNRPVNLSALTRDRDNQSQTRSDGIEVRSVAYSKGERWGGRTLPYWARTFLLSRFFAV